MMQTGWRWISRTDSCRATHEAAIRRSQGDASKNVFEFFLKRSQVRSGSRQRSKLQVLIPAAAEDLSYEEAICKLHIVHATD